MKIVILTYDSRSGSTFLSAELDKLRQVVVTPESAYITRLIEAEKLGQQLFDCPESVMKFLQSEVHFTELNLDSRSLQERMTDKKLDASKVINIVTQEVARKYNAAGGKVMVIKTPVFDHFNEIREKCFKDVAYIHLVRDPRAVHLSKSNSINLEGRPFSTNALKTALKWRYKIKLADKYTKSNPSSILWIRYEDLLEDTVGQIEKCAGFMGVPVLIGDSIYENLIGKAQGHLHENVGKAPIKSRSDAWQGGVSQSDKNVIAFLCKEQLMGLGYELGNENRLNVMPLVIWLAARYMMSSVVGIVKNARKNPELIRKKMSYLLHLVTLK